MVPRAGEVPAGLHVHGAVGIRGRDLDDDVVHHPPRVHLRPHDGDGITETRARELDEIEHHLVHPPRAARRARDERAMRLLEPARVEHEPGGRDDGAERSAQVVAEDRQETLLRLADGLAEAGDGFRDGLIDGLVESNQVLQIGGGDAGVLHAPQSNHARAKRAELGDHLAHGEAAARPPRAMRLRGGRFTRFDRVAYTRGLLVPCQVGLWSLEIRRDHEEHLFRVIAERLDIHRPPGGKAPRERLPLGEDDLNVVTDEAREPRRRLRGARGSAHARVPRAGSSPASRSRPIASPPRCPKYASTHQRIT